jgi:hypothetical protein
LVERLLHTGVVELCGAPDSRAPHVDGPDVGVRIEIDSPQHRGSHLVREQAGGALAEHGGVQRNSHVGEVQRLAATVCFEIDWAARRDERGDIGNCVTDEVSGAGTRDMHRLVQVSAAERVDRHQWDIGGVLIGQLDRFGAALRILDHVGREIAGHP